MLDNRFSRSRNVEIMVLTKMKMRKKEEDDDYSRLSLANIDEVEEPPPLPAEKHSVVKDCQITFTGISGVIESKDIFVDYGRVIKLWPIASFELLLVFGK